MTTENNLITQYDLQDYLNDKNSKCLPTSYTHELLRIIALGIISYRVIIYVCRLDMNKK